MPVLLRRYKSITRLSRIQCAVFIYVVLEEESWSDLSVHRGSWEKGMDLVAQGA